MSDGTAEPNPVVEAFEQMAPHYEETVDQELRDFWGFGYREFVGWLVDVAQLQDSDVILDVATGTAVIPLETAGRVGGKGRVVGLDITPAMLRHAKASLEAAELAHRVELVCASGMGMPFVGGLFDAVICGLGTHHMDVPTMLSEMRRVLRKGGKLVLADVAASPFWQSFLGTAALKAMFVWYGWTNRSARGQAEREALPNLRTAQQWHTLLLENGYSAVEISELGARRPWYPHALILKAEAGPLG